MEHLPSEIISEICDYILDTHPESLRSFAHSCASLRRIANVQLFRTVAIHLPEDKVVAFPVQRLNAILENVSGFQYVRNLTIHGTGWRKKSYWHEDWVLNYTVDGHASQAELSDYKTMWQQCAALIQRLSNLCDLTFSCDRQFPTCILEVLHSHLPHCRLHIDGFYIQSKIDPVTDPRELAIATSPNLHSICINLVIAYNGKRIDHIIEIALELMSGLAPNLKDVSIRSHFRDGDQVPLWRGLCGNNFVSKTGKGSVEKLKLQWAAPIPCPSLKDLSNHTDFSTLRSLELCGDFSSTDLECLPVEPGLASLKTFRLEHRSYTIQNPPDTVSRTVNSLLCHLPPLSVLVLKWVARPHLLASNIFDRHGKSLRTLKIRARRALTENQHIMGQWLLVPKHYLEIREKSLFRGLEYINIIIKRSKGDSEEINQYQTLGGLPRLHSATLYLNVCDYKKVSSMVRPTYAALDRAQRLYGRRNVPSKAKPCHDEVYDILVNSAVDEALALDIYRTMSSAKPPSSTKLRKLILRPDEQYLRDEDYRFNETSTELMQDLLQIVIFLCKCWRIEVCPASTASNEAFVQCTEEEQGVEPPQDGMVSELYDIIRQVWPEDPETSRGWENDWHSFPLQTQQAGHSEAST